MSIIRSGYLICAAVFFLHMFAFDGLSLFAIRIAAGVATGMYAGALIAKSYESTQAGKFTLAGIISFGSLGWFAGTMGTGVLKELFGGNINIVFTFSGSMFLAGFFISLLMGRKMQKEPEACAITEKPANVATTMQLLRQNKIVYSSFFLRQLGASAVWSMFPIFLAHELGAGDIWIGAIYATNAITQFLFMNWYGRTIHANYYRSIEIGAILSAAVFLAYFLSQSYFHIFPIQVVLGLSWSLLYMGSLLYLLDKNKEKATSSALLESTISVAAIIGPLAGGAIAEVSGIRSVLLFAFLMTLGSFAMSKRLARQTVAAQKVQG
ncbi:MAG: MFS transporter [Nitrososphaera sp.]